MGWEETRGREGEAMKAGKILTCKERRCFKKERRTSFLRPCLEFPLSAFHPTHDQGSSPAGVGSAGSGAKAQGWNPAGCLPGRETEASPAPVGTQTVQTIGNSCVLSGSGHEEVPQQASIRGSYSWGAVVPACLSVCLCLSVSVSVSPPSPESYSVPQAGLEFSI